MNYSSLAAETLDAVAQNSAILKNFEWFFGRFLKLGQSVFPEFFLSIERDSRECDKKYLE
jgi:hypothetical protein